MLRGGHLGVSTSGMAGAGFRHALLLQHSVQFIPWGCRDAVCIVVAMWLDGSARCGSAACQVFCLFFVFEIDFVFMCCRAAPTLPSISFHVQFALKTEKGSREAFADEMLPTLPLPIISIP